MTKKASSSLYEAARMTRDIEVLASGNLRRSWEVNDKLIGRPLGKPKI